MASNSIVRPKRTYFDQRMPWIELHDDVYVRQATQARCGICGRSTRFKSRYAAEHICSVECSNELWCQISENVATSSAGKKRK